MSPLVDKESLQREFLIISEIEKMREDYDKNKITTTGQDAIYKY
jgi:hypothetical protein